MAEAVPGAAPPPVASARALFPGAARRPYLNVALRSLLGSPVRRAMETFFDQWEAGNPDKRVQFDTLERGRERFARLVGAEEEEVAWVKNVTEGFTLFLTSLDWRDGDEVVLCPDLEHPANVLPWQNLAARTGVRLVGIPGDDGRLPSERIAEAVGPRTRVVTVAAVSFSPGFEADLEPIREACRRRGALFVVDAAQVVGTLTADVGALGCDVLSVGTQKGLLASYGTGFLWVRRDLAESLTPAALGRFGVRGDCGEEYVPVTDLPERGLSYAPGARRFELGNYNYLGSAAAEAGLEVIERFGAAAIERHNRGLAARLAEGLIELGLPVVGGAPGPHLAHIVSVGEAGGGAHDTVEDPAMASLHDHLGRRGIEHSVRRGVLRFSFHLYNDEGDVEQVLEAVRTWRGR